MHDQLANKKDIKRELFTNAISYCDQVSKLWNKKFAGVRNQQAPFFQVDSVKLKHLLSLCTATQAPYAFTTSMSMLPTDV